MKNRIVLTSIAILVLTISAFKIQESSNSECHTEISEYIEASDFFYHLGSRFSGITKSALSETTELKTFLKDEENQRILNYESSTVILVEKDARTDKRCPGSNAELNEAQRKFLKAMPYSQNFVVKMDVVMKSGMSGERYSTFTPHLTVVPQTQAHYETGNTEFIEYLKEVNKDYITSVERGQLTSAKLYFTIKTDGTIESIYLDRSCGYKHIDNAIIQHLKNTPKQWVPAKNTQGENVEQELVISFGLMGC